MVPILLLVPSAMLGQTVPRKSFTAAASSHCTAAWRRSSCGDAMSVASCLLCAGRQSHATTTLGACSDAELEAMCTTGPDDYPAPEMPDLSAPPPPAWGKPPPLGWATKREFLMRKNLTNFNQGSWGTCPSKVFDYHVEWMRAIEADPDRMYRPSLWATGSDPWDDAVKLARQAFARLVNAELDDLVFVPNASHGINAVLRCVARMVGGGGGKILFLDSAYSMVKQSLDFLGGRISGAANRTMHEGLVQVNISHMIPGVTDEQIVDAVNATLRQYRRGEIVLASFSHISSLPSMIMPVKQLAALCHEHGILVLIDGAHAPGQMAVDVSDIDADFYVGDGHKWLFTPKGVAFLHAKPTVQNLLYDFVIDGQGTFADFFAWQGLDDYSKYLGVAKALQFRQWLGGEGRIHRYTHALAVKGGHYLAQRWNTSLMVADNQFAALVSVRLPCSVAGPSGSVFPPCGKDFTTKLYSRFSTFVPSCTCGANSSEPFMRISVEVYNEMADFEMLGAAVETLIHNN